MVTFSHQLDHHRAILVADLVDLVGVLLVEDPEAVRDGLQPVGHLARGQEGLFQPLRDQRQLLLVLDCRRQSRAGKCNQKFTSVSGHFILDIDVIVRKYLSTLVLRKRFVLYDCTTP